MSIYHSFFFLSLPDAMLVRRIEDILLFHCWKSPQRIFTKIINSQPLNILNNIILSCKFAFSIILFHFVLFMKKSSECQLFTVWTQQTLPFPSAFKGVILSSGMPLPHLTTASSSSLTSFPVWFFDFVEGEHSITFTVLVWVCLFPWCCHGI